MIRTSDNLIIWLLANVFNTALIAVWLIIDAPEKWMVFLIAIMIFIWGLFFSLPALLLVPLLYFLVTYGNRPTWLKIALICIGGIVICFGCYGFAILLHIDLLYNAGEPLILFTIAAVLITLTIQRKVFLHAKNKYSHEK